MTAPPARSRWRWLWKSLLVLAVTLIVLAGGLIWYTTTDSFRNMVRNRIVEELERVTGGRAEFATLHVIPFRFRIEIRDLTIHGLEGPGQVPYVHVNSLIANVKVISALSAEFGFHSVIVDRPTIHILVYPDGSTSQPHPKPRPGSSGTDVQKLFALSINRLEVRHGKFLWNDQETPLDFIVDDVSADMTYSLLHRRYESNLLLGKIETKFDGYRPLAWMAEAHFSLGRNGIEVHSLRASSGRSHLQAVGRLRDFTQPVIEGNYDASIDLEEAAAVARRTEVRHGILQLGGSGKWSLEDYSSSGKLLLKDLDWKDGGLGAHSATLTAQYAITPQRLTLTKIDGKTFGGSVAGDAEVINWRHSHPGVKPGKVRAFLAAEQKGIVRLKVRGVSVGEVADLISSPKFPLGKINLAGTGDGALEARWIGALSNLDADVVLDVTPPAHATYAQLPLNAHGRITYHAARQELEVADLTAITRATQVHASGALAPGSSLKLSVSTTDLNEWQPVLLAFHTELPEPTTLQGRASFNGTASGKLSDISLAGNLQAENFTVVVPATARTPERPVHWDAVSASIQLSQRMFSAHNGSLRHDDTEIGFDVSMGLDHGHFTENSPLNGRVDMRRTDAGAILALAGLNYPVSGTLELHITAEGTKSNLTGEGRIVLTNATVYGRGVEHFESRVRFSGEQAELSNFVLVFSDSELSGSAAYNFSARTVRLDVNGKNLDLARIPQQSGRLGVEGRADFTLVASGKVLQPSLTAVVHLRNLSVEREHFGDFILTASTEGQNLKLNGHSQFEKSELTLSGSAALHGDWPCDINIAFKDLDAAPLLLASFNNQVSHHFTATGSLEVKGPLLRPAELQVSGTLDSLSTDLEQVELHNNGSVHFTVSNELLQVQQLHLVGPRTDLSGSGTIHLVGNRELDLRAHGQINLRLIESFNRDFTSSGGVTVDLTVVGTLANPIAQGRLQVTNANIAYLDLPSGLSQMNGTLVFNQSRVQIESLTARTGGGSVTLGGFAMLQNGRLAFDLNAHGEGVRLRYPPGISSTANADVRFAGTSDASTLSGNVTVTKLSVTPGFDFGAYLARSAQSTALPETSPLLNRIRLDVHVTTLPELQMQTTQLRLSGDADLRLRGTAAKPTLLGRAEVIEGDVYFNGTKYHMERGDVNFIPPGIQPAFDLQMSTQVRDYDITIRLTGPLNKLTLSYRSEPPLPEADIVALLALGRTREESAQLQQNSSSPFNQEASSAILNEALNAVVSNRVQRLFGGSRIKIDPQGLNTETNPQRGPQVTIEQQVTRNLTITYSTAVSQSSEQIIEVEYNLPHNFSIVALRDQNGVVSFDVRLRQRKK